MSSQQQVSVSISSSQRDLNRWPHANKYEVKLPMAIPRVRQVMLAAFDMPLNQRTVECGQGEFPYDEGISIHATNGSSTECVSAESPCCNNEIRICEEDGSEVLLALPLRCNEVTSATPVTTCAGRPGVRVVTDCPHGLHCVCLHMWLCVGDVTVMVNNPRTISRCEVELELCGDDELPEEEVQGCLAVAPLQRCEVQRLLQAQLEASTCVRNCYEIGVDAEGRLEFRAQGQGLRFAVSVGWALQELLGFGVDTIHSCPDANNTQIARGLRPAPFMTARVVPGDYDPSTMGSALYRALNALYFGAVQPLMVRLATGVTVTAWVRPGMYTHRWLAAEVQRALTQAPTAEETPQAVQTFVVTWSTECQRFTLRSARPFTLCLQQEMSSHPNSDLLQALGLCPAQYTGPCVVGVRVEVPWPLERGHLLYKIGSGYSKCVNKSYSISASLPVFGESDDKVNPCTFDNASVSTPDELMERAQSVLRQYVTQFGTGATSGADVGMVTSKMIDGETVWVLVFNWCTSFQVGDVLWVRSPQIETLQPILVQVVQGGGFSMQVEICSEELADSLETILSSLTPSEDCVSGESSGTGMAVPVRAWVMGTNCFTLRFAGQTQMPLIRRLGFRYEEYCGAGMYESVMSWDLDRPSFLLLQLGTPRSGAPWKYYTATGQLVPFFAALGTSSRFSRVYQDSADYKTSGSVTVGTVSVEILNPDLTPYHFHGQDHYLTLNFVTEGDQALLSCS